RADRRQRHDLTRPGQCPCQVVGVDVVAAGARPGESLLDEQPAQATPPDSCGWRTGDVSRRVGPEPGDGRRRFAAIRAVDPVKPVQFSCSAATPRRPPAAPATPAPAASPPPPTPPARP